MPIRNCATIFIKYDEWTRTAFPSHSFGYAFHVALLIKRWRSMALQRWKVLEKDFCLSDNSMWSIVQAIHKVFRKGLMKRLDEKYWMTYLIQWRNLFYNFLYACYATNTQYQQANTLTGLSLAEAKRYFSEKHKMYGYKSELSVFPNIICISSCVYAPGSVAYITIFRGNFFWHLTAIGKTGDERHSVDAGELKEEFPYNWAIQADKRYQGVLPRNKFIGKAAHWNQAS